MTPEETELDRSRRKARRKLGIAAFGLIAIESLAMTGGVFWGGPVFASNLEAATPVLTALFWVQAAVVGAYLGVSVTEAIKRKA